MTTASMEMNREDAETSEEVIQGDKLLLKELKETEESIQKLEEEFRSIKVAMTIPEDGDPQPVIFKHKEAKLLAELKILKEKAMSGIPNSYLLQIELLKKQMEEQEESLNKTLKYFKEQNEDSKSEKQMFQKFIMEEQHLIGILEEELKKEELEPKAETSRTIEGLKARFAKAKALTKYRMKETRLFLEKYYSLPDELTLSQVVKDPISTGNEVRIKSLGELVELLLNSAMEKPYNPWIPVDNSIWPPYIELLHRYGVIIKHPEKPEMIKLECSL